MAYELIETVTVGSGGAASIEFTSIPQDGVDLLLKFSLRAALGAGNQLFIWPNSASTYSDAAITLRTIDGIVASATDTGDRNGYTPTSTYTAATFGSGYAYISNYAGSSDKNMMTDTVSENNSSSVYKMSMQAARFDISAVTSLILLISGDSIAEHSSASLYKITAD